MSDETGQVRIRVAVEVTHDHGKVHVVEEQSVHRATGVSEAVGAVTQRACSRAQASLEPERPGA